MKKSLKDTPTPTQEVVESDAQNEDLLEVTKEELQEFLTSIQGIGKKKFAAIMEHFGSVENVLEALQNDIKEEFSKVESMTPELAKKVAKTWKKLFS